MARALLLFVIVGLAVYAVVDVSNSDEEDRMGLPAGLWMVAVVVLPIVGPLMWFAVSRSQRARQGAGGPPPRPSAPSRPARQQPQRPLAPDDDPEFLWRLEQEQRRRDRERGQQGPGTSDEDGPDTPDDHPGTPGADGSRA